MNLLLFALLWLGHSLQDFLQFFLYQFFLQFVSVVHLERHQNLDLSLHMPGRKFLQKKVRWKNNQNIMTPTFPKNLEKFKTFIWIWTCFATPSPFFILAIFSQLRSTPILPPMGHAHILRFSSDFEAFKHTGFSLLRSTDYNTFAIYLVKKISLKYWYF